jgi:hypothetical protein
LALDVARIHGRMVFSKRLTTMSGAVLVMALWRKS